MQHLLLLCLPALMAVAVAASGPDVKNCVVEVYQDVILPCVISSDITGKTFNWKKDKKEVFLYDKGNHYNNGHRNEDQDPQFKDRVEFFSNELQHGNASIKIKSAKVNDSGVYTCIQVSNGEHSPVFKVNLKVDCTLKDRSTGPNAKDLEGACSKPGVKELAKTKEGVLLQCVVLGAFPKPEVEWQDSSNNTVQSKHRHDEEMRGIYNVIIQTFVKKTDKYRCVVKQLDICHALFSDWIHVDVTVSEGRSFDPWIGFIVTLVLLVVLVAVLITCYISKNNNQGRLSRWCPCLSKHFMMNTNQPGSMEIRSSATNESSQSKMLSEQGRNDGVMQ